MAKVQVFSFRTWNNVKVGNVESKRYATDSEIKRVGAEKIEGSGIAVEDKHLDRGMTAIGYKPIHLIFLLFYKRSSGGQLRCMFVLFYPNVSPSITHPARKPRLR